MDIQDSFLAIALLYSQKDIKKLLNSKKKPFLQKLSSRRKVNQATFATTERAKIRSISICPSLEETPMAQECFLLRRQINFLFYYLLFFIIELYATLIFMYK